MTDTKSTITTQSGEISPAGAILTSLTCYVDGSMTGEGKTIMSTREAQAYEDDQKLRRTEKQAKKNAKKNAKKAAKKLAKQNSLPAPTPTPTQAPTPTPTPTFKKTQISKEQFDTLPAFNLPYSVDYIVFKTEYTSRLLEKELLIKLYNRVKELQTEHKDYDFMPMFIHDNSDDDNNEDNDNEDTKSTGYTNINPGSPQESLALSESILPFVGTGTIAFATTNFAEMFMLMNLLRELEYCYMGDIEGIRLIELSHDALGTVPVKIAVVTVDCESG